jgi:inosine/xanthosine triphosphate pyrophosphatase family protein
MGKEYRKIVLASRNRDKIREMQELCQGLPFEVGSSLDYPGLPDVIEDGTSEVGNACRKAIVTAAYTGEIAVADDTSFQVQELNNLPDIFASRFAGPDATYADNANLILELMKDVPDGFRQACFVTAAVWVDPKASQGFTPETKVTSPAKSRWLHNPFTKGYNLPDPWQRERLEAILHTRREVWRQYKQDIEAVLVDHGSDRDRLRGVIARLLAPYLAGGRPEGTDPTAIMLPDTRLYTTAAPLSDGRADPARGEVPAGLLPSGMPADAPGRTSCDEVWVEISAMGRLLGEITRQPLGHNGFGYDPIFRLPASDRTLAELESTEKNAISHRGRALRRLLAAVKDAYQVMV